MSLDISISLTLTEEQYQTENVHLRLISTWADCITTDTLVGSTTWEVAQPEQPPETEEATSLPKTCHWKKNIKVNLDTKEKLQTFHANPSIYCLLLSCNLEKYYKPMNFAAVDCSSLLMQRDTITTSTCSVDGMQLSMSISSSAPLMSMEKLIVYEPMVLKLYGLNDFPSMACAATDLIYTYNHLNFGGTTRTVFAVPDENQQFHYATCILSGLLDLKQFKESLLSTTFQLEIFCEALHTCVLTSSTIEKYNEFFPKTTTEEVAAPAAAPAKAAKKGAAPPVETSPRTPIVTIKESTSSITDADKYILERISTTLQHISQSRTHGQARFRLEQLLLSSNDLLLEFSKKRQNRDISNETVVIKEDIVADVLTTKPNKPERWHMPADLSLKKALAAAQQERLDSTISNTQQFMSSTLKKTKTKPLSEAYGENNTVLLMSVEFHRKYVHPEEIPTITSQRKNGTSANTSIPALLADQLAVTPFTRMIFIFKYDDTAMLNAINNAINAVNTRALPDIQGTMRSYAFSDREVELANNAELDVICGFSIIDDDMRVIVIEGLAGVDLGMQSVYLDIPRPHANDSTLKILCNPEVLFPKRLYTEFGPDLKRVRPREKLQKLAKRPELYNRKQVDKECFDAVDYILNLRRAPDLKTTKELNCYPQASWINQLELLYGDALSKQDLDGVVAPVEASQSQDFGIETMPSIDTFESHQTQKQRSHRLQPTVCRNPEFDTHLRTRAIMPPKDYLAEQRELRKAAWKRGLENIARREYEDAAIVEAVLGPDATNKHIYCYSGQALNFKDKMTSVMREKLRATKNATFTFSEEYFSSTVVLVDEEADRKKIKEAERKKWTTARGFVYPPPKTRKELLQHPKRPSDACIEDLHEPYEIFEQQTVDPVKRELERNFDTVPRSKPLFGMLEPPEFARPFQLKHIGDRTHLPRGMMTGGTTPNPSFWQSVHLSGDASAAAQIEAAEKEKKEWEEKVVVDHLDFKVGGFKERDKTIQADKTKDILKDEPKTKALKHIREMKSATGRDFGYKPAPLSILSTGEYVPNAMEKSLLRSEDKNQFITMRGASEYNDSMDFTRYIHKDTGKPLAQSFIAKKKHPELKESEKTGPRWEHA